MPDRVNAPMNLHQVAGGEPTFDRVYPNPSRQQLPPSHHTVLTLRKLPHNRIDLPFPSYNAGFGRCIRHDPSVARKL